MRKGWLGGLALVVAVVAACGDDDDEDTAAVASTETTAAAATTASAAATTAAPRTTVAAATTAADPYAVPTTAVATTAVATTAVATTAAPAAASEEPACRPVGDMATADTTVEYQLEEFEFVGPSASSSGSVGFSLTNIGRAPHEMVVIRADSYESLPKNEHGTVLEDQLPAGAVIGEVDRFPGGGQTCTGVFDLAPAAYVLVCNIEFQNGPQIVSHAGRGMYVDFSVA